MDQQIRDRTLKKKVPGKAKRFTITTLGCKVNQYESETIARELTDSACKRLDDSRRDGKDEPDVCIINTCTVTHKASMQSRQAIRQAVRRHPGAMIVVTGCYAQTEPGAIRKIEGVHRIVGHRDKHLIPSMVRPSRTAAVSRPFP